MKTYLAVVSLLLLCALAMGVYVWFRLQTLETHRVVAPAVAPVHQHGAASSAAPRASQVPTDTAVAPQAVQGASEAEASPETSIEDLESVPIVVKQENLNETQQKALETLGLGDGDIVITPAMSTCATNALGADRVDAIVAGAAPGPLEVLQILGCLE